MALTAMPMKSTFWDVMLCSTTDCYQCFIRTYCLHRQGRGISQANPALEMEAATCSEMSVTTQQTTSQKALVFQGYLESSIVQ
jgi:hypothetical protein